MTTLKILAAMAIVFAICGAFWFIAVKLKVKYELSLQTKKRIEELYEAEQNAWVKYGAYWFDDMTDMEHFIIAYTKVCTMPTNKEELAYFDKCYANWRS